ncbi:Holliday junction DNA helicase RuvB C-terminal domain-containing protein, partial [Helicobacter typhlonius]|uniref:Holliday junction DNA helicase RuvB C-terminal domain-containing protein n=1 Tax=Helicobacter typhlonius TaxID=76936 RepID=UPI002FE1129E
DSEDTPTNGDGNKYREDEATIEDVIEPYLLVNAYLERTAKGRVATAKTYELLQIPNVMQKTLF